MLSVPTSRMVFYVAAGLFYRNYKARGHPTEDTPLQCRTGVQPRKANTLVPLIRKWDKKEVQVKKSVYWE